VAPGRLGSISPIRRWGRCRCKARARLHRPSVRHARR
jgi:hypothetical protein